MNKICLIGDGWGAISAFNSLVKSFKSLYVMTTDNDLLSLLRDVDCQQQGFEDGKFDLIICAGYKKIIPNEFIENNKVINIHYSLLPKYRGMHSVVWAILNGEKELGLTIHEMNEFIDDGDIIFQHKFDYNNETATAVMEYCNDFIERNLYLIVGKYLNFEISVLPQDKKNASWVCKRNFDDCQIDFTRQISYLKRLFKALTFPYPVPFFYYNNKKVSVKDVVFFENETIMTCGRIVNIDNDGAWVQVADGYMVISQVEDEEGNFLNVKSMKIGTRL